MFKVKNSVSDSGLSEFGTNIPESSEKNSKSTRVSEPTPLSDDKDQKDVTSLVQWSICGPNTYKPVSHTFPKLERGVYNIYASQNQGIVFEKKTICVDELLKFPDSVSDKILQEITEFWKRGDKFKYYNFLHRRGYLLHGPTGSGKSALIQLIIAEIIENDGLVFQCTNHPSVFNDGLANFRKIEPYRPIISLFEDIDAIIDEYGEDEILSLMDGENQVNFCLNIASTNYPEKLDPRLVARPRRFDRIVKISHPSKEVRKIYFEKKLKIEKNELETWVNSTEGFSFAACAELVISVKCFEKSFDQSIEILKEMSDIKISSTDYGKEAGVGFGSKVGFVQRK